MELDITRVDRQKAGVEKWRASNGIGTLVHPPRFGKTFETIEFIINPHLNINANNCVNILVPSEITHRQWIDNLKSYCNDLGRVAVYTAHYVESNPGFAIESTLLVVDEPQKFLTDGRKAMIDGTIFIHHYRLALTGTYPYDVEWFAKLYPVVDKITEEEAITNGWTSPFLEYNILLEFPAADKARYEKFTKPIIESMEIVRPLLSTLTREEGRRIFNSELELLNACHRGFETTRWNGTKKWVTYDQLCNTIAIMQGWNTTLDVSVPFNANLNELWNPHAIHNRGKIFMDYIAKRNSLMIDNNVKLEMVASIIARNMTKTIVFNESTVFADRLTEYLTARFQNTYHTACYHSNIDSKVMIDPTTGTYFKYTTGDRKGYPKTMGKIAIKKLVIEGFKHGYYSCLCTAKALDEGLDIPDIQQVICTGGTTNPMTYQQRIARGKTFDSLNPNKVTRIFNLVFDDFVNSDGDVVTSRDKTKLIKRQKQSGSSVRWLSDLNEINFSDSE